MAEIEYINWLENSINKESIHYYEYSEFKDLQPVSMGAMGSVFRCNWKNTFLILKSFHNQISTLKEIINEVNIYESMKH